MKIAIRGLGVAGSYIAYLLSQNNIDVYGYDIMRKYMKPCGDAVTLRPWIKALLEELKVVKTRVKNIKVLSNGKNIVEASSKEPYWYIIDKPLLVEKLREKAAKHGAVLSYGRGEQQKISEKCIDCLWIDARGPYIHLQNKNTYVITLRYFVETSWDPELALLDFRPSLGGLFWIFPADSEGRIVNMGGGFFQTTIEQTMRYVEEYIRKNFSNYRIITKSAAPIALLSNISLIEKENSTTYLKVGESAGLVISTAGEGNRPALESAKILSEILLEKTRIDIIEKTYRSRLNELISEVKASRQALLLAMKMGDRFSEFAQKLPLDFWENYLRGKITMGYLIKLLMRRPGLLKYFF